MVDILHRVGITSPSSEAVYDALTQRDGLAGWWTHDTQGSGAAPGDKVAFRFANGGFDMLVLDARPGEHVRWEVVDGPEEWIGTEIHWDLAREGDHTVVLFKHAGWREPVDFMHHCSTKWGSYLQSLKQLVETGTGAPHPHDVKIDHWD